MQKYEYTGRVLRYNNLICYVSNIIAVFQSFHCPSFATFFNETFDLKRRLNGCSEDVKIVSPTNVHQIRETRFDKLVSFGIKYISLKKLFKNLALFDLELICDLELIFKDTKTTTWVGKLVPASVSCSSNVVYKPIFLCNSDPHYVAASFIGALEGFASQSIARPKILTVDIGTTIKNKLGSILEKLTQCQNRWEQARFDMSWDDCENGGCASTHFLQTQKVDL